MFIEEAVVQWQTEQNYYLKYLKCDLIDQLASSVIQNTNFLMLSPIL